MPTRRQQLVSVAARLFSERGYHAVGVNDIGEALGLTGPALYRHFESKQALLVAVFERVVDQIMGQVREIAVSAQSPGEAIDLMVTHHATFAIDERALLTTWRHEVPNLPEDDRRRLRRAQRLYLEEWVHVVVELRADVSDVEARAAVHAAIGLLQSPIYQRAELPREEMIELLRRIALSALLPAGPRRHGTVKKRNAA